jgi:K+-transporting ATPase KdpF subunit
MHYSKRGFLPAGYRLHHRLQPARHKGEQIMIETLLLGLVTVALLVYLVYALLRPENF